VITSADVPQMGKEVDHCAATVTACSGHLFAPWRKAFRISGFR
jgi:hypothetical protein